MRTLTVLSRQNEQSLRNEARSNLPTRSLLHSLPRKSVGIWNVNVMSLLTVHVLIPGIDESVSDAPEALHGEGEAGEGDVLIEHPGVLSGAHHEPILGVALALLGQPGQGG